MRLVVLVAVVVVVAGDGSIGFGVVAVGVWLFDAFVLVALAVWRLYYSLLFY
jgi:hypothetical protein